MASPEIEFIKQELRQMRPLADLTVEEQRAAGEDSTTAYRWLLAQGIAPNRIAISGDSAGGGLTLTPLIALRDAGTPLPAAAVPLSPWTDMEGTGESITSRAEHDPLIHE